MTDQLDSPTTPTPKRKGGLILGLVLAVIGAGGGFAIVGLDVLGIMGGGDVVHEASHEAEAAPAMPDLPKIAAAGSFVSVPPMVVPMGRITDGRQLRFRGELEVSTDHEEEVQALMPRIVDTFQGYLRALGPDDLDQPAALVHLRAQMLRRAQLVAGHTAIRDLLIMEFVLN